MHNKHCITIKQKTIGAGTPAVCVPLASTTDEQIIEQARRIALTKGVDVAEFRADFYEGLADTSRLKALMKKIREILGDILLLFTIRSEAEGGEPLSFSSPTLCEINQYVIENKLADLVDIELFSGDEKVEALVSRAHEQGVCVIMSNHDFHATPSKETIIERLCHMQSLGADIAKIAVMPQNKQDVLTLLSATECMYREHATGPIITISMGALGAISRVSGELFGSAMTFAALGQASAPGQIPVDELSDMMKKMNRYCV